MKQEPSPNGNQASNSQAPGYFDKIGSAAGPGLAARGDMVSLDSIGGVSARVRADLSTAGGVSVSLYGEDGLSLFLIESEARALLDFLKMVLEPGTDVNESDVSGEVSP